MNNTSTSMQSHKAIPFVLTVEEQNTMYQALMLALSSERTWVDKVRDPKMRPVYQTYVDTYQHALDRLYQALFC